MDPDQFYLIGIIIAAVLALANVWRGAVLMKQGARGQANKRMMYGAAMMLFMAALLVFKQG